MQLTGCKQKIKTKTIEEFWQMRAVFRAFVCYLVAQLAQCVFTLIENSQHRKLLPFTAEGDWKEKFVGSMVSFCKAFNFECAEVHLRD